MFDDLDTEVLRAGQDCLKMRQHFIVEPGDRLIRRNSDIYYVLARPRYFSRFFEDGAGLLGLGIASPFLLMFAVPILLMVFSVQRSAKVGVVRFADDGSEKPRVIYVDKPVSRELADARAAELAAEIEAGKFDRDTVA